MRILARFLSSMLLWAAVMLTGCQEQHLGNGMYRYFDWKKGQWDTRTDWTARSLELEYPWNDCMPFKSDANRQTLPDLPDNITAISAWDIIRKYKNNEVAADEWLKGKKFAVCGQVDRVGKDIFGRPYVELYGFRHLHNSAGVQCFFSPDDAEQMRLVSGLSSGRLVVIVGIGNGKALFSPLMRNCVIHSISQPKRP